MQKVFEFGGARLRAPEGRFPVGQRGFPVIQGQKRVSQSPVQLGLDRVGSSKKGQRVFGLLALFFESERHRGQLCIGVFKSRPQRFGGGSFGKAGLFFFAQSSFGFGKPRAERFRSCDLAETFGLGTFKFCRQRRGPRIGFGQSGGRCRIVAFSRLQCGQGIRQGCFAGGGFGF